MRTNKQKALINNDRHITEKELRSERFDCTQEHLLKQIMQRANYYFKRTDGSFSFPDAGGHGQLIEIIEMTLAASLKPDDRNLQAEIYKLQEENKILREHLTRLHDDISDLIASP